MSRNTFQWISTLIIVFFFVLCPLVSSAATFSVLNYGAKANDGMSDENAFNAAVNASANGDTIYFPTGTFNVDGDGFNLPSNRIIKGDGMGKTIIKNSSTAGFTYTLKIENRSGITMSDFTLDGNGVYMGNVDGVQWTKVEMVNLNRSADNHQGIFGNGLRNVTVKDSVFRNIRHVTMIYNVTNVRFERNRITDVGYGLKLQAPMEGLYIIDNIFEQVRASMGVELQGNITLRANNIRVEYNQYINPKLNAGVTNSHAFCYSLVPENATNMVVYRNYCEGNTAYPKRGVVLAYEIAGNAAGSHCSSAATKVYENWAKDLNDCGGITTSRGVQAFNNRCENTIEAFGFASPANGIADASQCSNISNNGLTTLSWASSFKKNQFWNLDGTQPPPVNPPVTPPPGPVTNAPLPTDGGVYLSDLDFSGENQWGPFELDMSNGEQAAGDGKKIQFGLTSYAKGIGAHAPANLIFELDGNYDTLRGLAGIDAESGANGSATLEVLLDGQSIYTSATLRGNQTPVSLDLDVRNGQILELKIHNGGDSNDYDHVSLAFFRLIDSAPPTNPPTVTDAPLPSDGGHYLSDLGFSGQNFWGPFELDSSNGEQAGGDGRKIQFGTTGYTKGIGAHASANLIFPLNNQYTALRGFIGIDAEVGANGSAIVEIYRDGEKIYTSPLLLGGQSPKELDLDVQNALSLEIKILDGGNGTLHDHVSLAHGRLIPKIESVTPPSSNPSGSDNNGTRSFSGDFSDGSTSMSCSLQLDSTSANPVKNSSQFLLLLVSMVIVILRRVTSKKSQKEQPGSAHTT